MSEEARAWALLTPSERPDLVNSVKLGLDPSAPVITSQYQFAEVLGRGAYGEVVLATHTDSGKQYAIKKLATPTLKRGSLKNEVAVLRDLRHPNIISLREVFATEEYVYLVMEFAKGGALFDVVARDGVLCESFAAAATMQIASALSFMHRRGVVHRDMKPENILLADTERKIVKVCDFGLSKIFERRSGKQRPQQQAMTTHGSTRGSSSDSVSPGAALPERSGFGSRAGSVLASLATRRTGTRSASSMMAASALSTSNSVASATSSSMTTEEKSMLMKSRVGTQWYASPELLTLKEGVDSYDQSIDMWGLGLVVYVLISGVHPFEGPDMYGAITSAKVDFAEAAWEQVSPSAADLVRKLLRAKSSERLTADAVLSHPWMADGLHGNDKLERSLIHLRALQARHLHEATCKVIANALTTAEVADVRTIFEQIDSDNKGYLTHEDLHDALNHKARTMLGMQGGRRQQRATVTGRYNLPRLMRLLLNSTSSVADELAIMTFEMFLTAVLEQDDELVRHHLLRVFRTIDVHDTGAASVSDVEGVLADFGLDADGMFQAQTMLRRAAARAQDDDEGGGGGTVSYATFVEVLLREHREDLIQEIGRRTSTANSSPSPSAPASSTAVGSARDTSEGNGGVATATTADTSSSSRGAPEAAATPADGEGVAPLPKRYSSNVASPTSSKPPFGSDASSGDVSLQRWGRASCLSRFTSPRHTSLRHSDVSGDSPGGGEMSAWARCQVDRSGHLRYSASPRFTSPNPSSLPSASGAT